MDCPGWDDDDTHLPYCRQARYLIGCIVIGHLVIEIYLPEQVWRQFGEAQDVPIGLALFA